MDYKRREEIFAKDYITVKELQELLGYKYSTQASEKMRQIKRTVGDRLGVRGKIHTEDYFIFFDIQPNNDRYKRLVEESPKSENETDKYNPIREGNKRMQDLNYEIFKQTATQGR